jgi:hypothetical protein
VIVIDAKGKKAKSAKGGGGGFGAKPPAQANFFFLRKNSHNYTYIGRERDT